MTAQHYIVRTAFGERRWFADDAGHAREQHEDAFGGQDDETILEVRLDVDGPAAGHPYLMHPQGEDFCTETNEDGESCGLPAVEHP